MITGSTANDRDNEGQTKFLHVTKGSPVITNDSSGQSKAVSILIGSGRGLDENQCRPTHSCDEYSGLFESHDRGKSSGCIFFCGNDGRIVRDERGRGKNVDGTEDREARLSLVDMEDVEEIEYRISVLSV